MATGMKMGRLTGPCGNLKIEARALVVYDIVRSLSKDGNRDKIKQNIDKGRGYTDGAFCNDFEGESRMLSCGHVEETMKELSY